MDLDIRGRSQDQRGARPWDTGRTRMERGRTGPEGEGGPEWFRADRTRGHGGKSRGGPREQEAAAAVGECTPEGARGAGQGSSTEWSSQKQLQQFQCKPASDEWDRAHKCLLASQV